MTTTQRSRLFVLLSSGFLLQCTIAIANTTTSDPAVAADERLPAPLLVQRVAYQKAIYNLNTGRIKNFQQAKKALKEYPLYPYLEYYDLQRNLNRLKHSAVARFQKDWPEGPLADRLYRNWMRAIAKRGDWKRYLKYYQPTSDTKRRCYYLRALYRTGQKEQAMAGVQSLWLTPRSQPKACDPLFATWIENGHLTTAIAWQRLILALEARQRTLARFLLRYFDGTWKTRANTLYRVHRQPDLLANYKNFITDQRLTRDIIRIGLIRWAAKDPAAAMSAWQRYQTTHSFTALEGAYIRQALEIQLATHDLTEGIQTVSPSPDGRHLLLLEALTLSAVRQGQWSQVAKWIGQMPYYEQIRPRWRYWRGRAALALPDEKGDANQNALIDLRRLARQRNYYGFLAADLLHMPPRLNHALNRRNRESETRVKSIPSVARALELFALDDLTNARREWLNVSQRLSLKDLAVAANLAAEVGWLDQSIRTANAADLYDAVELRFPTPWQLTFRKEGYASGLPVALLYAIVRQESAFDATARSGADARGLMQLLPSTASLTARRLGLKPPQKADLARPEVNIKLGSQYLASLLLRYNGTLQYAIAAYNAGPFRVDRWLKESPDSDPDVWTEAIPFRETRNYVKNVMAFRRVYQQRLALEQQHNSSAGYPQFDRLDFEAGDATDSAEPLPGQRANPDLQSFPLH